MLESMSPEEFEEWCVKDEVEPIGYASQTLGMIVYLLQAYMTQGSADAESFMPWLKYTAAPSNDNAQARQLLQQIAGGHQ